MPQSTEENFLESARKLFRYYKALGEKTMNQLNDEQVLTPGMRDGTACFMRLIH